MWKLKSELSRRQRYGRCSCYCHPIGIPRHSKLTRHTEKAQITHFFEFVHELLHLDLSWVRVKHWLLIQYLQFTLFRDPENPGHN